MMSYETMEGMTTMYYVPPYYPYYYAPISSYRSGCGCSSPTVAPYQYYTYGQPYTYFTPSAYTAPWTMEQNAATDNRLEEYAGATETSRIVLQDYGPHPLVIDIEDAAEDNTNYRTTLWTGPYLQVTLMSIPVGGDIGLEVHPSNDQFIRIEEGKALVQMGPGQHQLNYERRAEDGYAVMVPAGTWHNVTNVGREPLKVYVIYAPPHHPHGTVHHTKAEALAEGD